MNRLMLAMKRLRWLFVVLISFGLGVTATVEGIRFGGNLQDNMLYLISDEGGFRFYVTRIEADGHVWKLGLKSLPYGKGGVQIIKCELDVENRSGTLRLIGVGGSAEREMESRDLTIDQGWGDSRPKISLSDGVQLGGEFSCPITSNANDRLSVNMMGRLSDRPWSKLMMGLHGILFWLSHSLVRDAWQ
ncbi:MAG: hypothetical protein HY343_10955 [Lentisphaerae bacterium]|nr:hypothetical protein [Lentisphaerota bacterium]